MAAIRHPGRLTVASGEYSDVRPVAIHAGLLSIGMFADEAATFAKELIIRIAALNHDTAITVLSDVADILTKEPT